MRSWVSPWLVVDTKKAAHMDGLVKRCDGFAVSELHVLQLAQYAAGVVQFGPDILVLLLDRTDLVAQLAERSVQIANALPHCLVGQYELFDAGRRGRAHAHQDCGHTPCGLLLVVEFVLLRPTLRMYLRRVPWSAPLSLGACSTITRTGACSTITRTPAVRLNFPSPDVF